MTFRVNSELKEIGFPDICTSFWDTGKSSSMQLTYDLKEKAQILVAASASATLGCTETQKFEL